jgi:hypothetical protein
MVRASARHRSALGQDLVNRALGGPEAAQDLGLGYSFGGEPLDLVGLAGARSGRPLYLSSAFA